mmetsp:Transcript_88364/g.176692  ORF Transcript_88364/g.176692 Transcript_88364/m.176692 type:complete len:213 (-) Transcript_88364:1813-2451(-)
MRARFFFLPLSSASARSACASARTRSTASDAPGLVAAAFAAAAAVTFAATSSFVPPPPPLPPLFKDTVPRPPPFKAFSQSASPPFTAYCIKSGSAMTRAVAAAEAATEDEAEASTAAALFDFFALLLPAAAALLDMASFPNIPCGPMASSAPSCKSSASVKASAFTILRAALAACWSFCFGAFRTVCSVSTSTSVFKWELTLRNALLKSAST